MRNIATSVRRLGWLCVLSALAPGVAFAHSGGSSASASSPAGHRVSQNVSHELGAGCTYRASIRGEVRGSSATNEYSGRLTITPSVACADDTFLKGPARGVRFANVRRDVAERQIDRAGRVASDAGDKHCNYAPRFSLRRGSITARDVSFACRTSTRADIGGGPK